MVDEAAPLSVDQEAAENATGPTTLETKKAKGLNPAATPFVPGSRSHPAPQAKGLNPAAEPFVPRGLFTTAQPFVPRPLRATAKHFVPRSFLVPPSTQGKGKGTYKGTYKGKDKGKAHEVESLLAESKKRCEEASISCSK
ncbi:hypothetical protein PG991_015927 [Apiospora marii]|uniref:Uncharacterized protein n=1 Tax=Apiospora marii TaxID=335849 RepID=A0ABR1R023_9PEZI